MWRRAAPAAAAAAASQLPAFARVWDGAESAGGSVGSSGRARRPPTPADGPSVFCVSPLRVDADLLSALRRDDARGGDILRALQAAAATPDGKLRGMPSVVFHSRAHEELALALASHARRLAAGAFIGVNGCPARTLQGAKGIGKTTMLREFAVAAEAAFPNVIVVYVSFEGVTRVGMPLAASPLLDVVTAALRDRGVDVDYVTPSDLARGYHQGIQLSHALEDSGKFLLLLVDELDELYKVAPTDAPLFRMANNSLAELQWLGTQSAGRFGTLLCGSSAVTPLLIVGNAQGLVDEFPRVVGAPNLNGTKFRELRITTPLCTDLGAVREVLEAQLGGRRASLDLTRLVAFTAGAAARDVIAVAQGRARVAALEERTPSWSKTSARTLVGDAGKLLHALVLRMAVDNAALCDSLLTDGRVDARKAAIVTWEREFRPLSWKCVEEEWARLAASGTVDAASGAGEQLANLVYRACDRGMLAYDGIEDGVPAAVYPYSILQVARARSGLSRREAFIATWDLDVEAVWHEHAGALPLGALPIIAAIDMAVAV